MADTLDGLTIPRGAPQTKAVAGPMADVIDIRPVLTDDMTARVADLRRRAADARMMGKTMARWGEHAKSRDRYAQADDLLAEAIRLENRLPHTRPRNRALAQIAGGVA